MPRIWVWPFMARTMVEEAHGVKVRQPEKGCAARYAAAATV
jgi:hypothetical protein